MVNYSCEVSHELADFYRMVSAEALYMKQTVPPPALSLMRTQKSPVCSRKAYGFIRQYFGFSKTQPN
jgi:hypothetical protein